MRTRVPFALAACAVALAGCQGGSDDAEKAELEARIAELEEQLADTTDEAEAAVAEETGASEPEPERRASGGTPTDPPDEAAEEPERRETAPTPEPLVLPRGTLLAVVLETPLSSKSNQVGDRVVARVSEATGPDGAIDLPDDAILEGRITAVERSGKVKGRARLVFAFDRLVAGGQERDTEATGLAIEADKDAKRDAALVGGGAAAGAIIGGIVGGKKGAGRGALLGGAAGGGAVLLTRGDEVEIAAGYGFTSELLTDLRL